ncbi:hypothetical protein LCGC14_2703060, partial [marine sediment metagenome]
AGKGKKATDLAYDAREHGLCMNCHKGRPRGRTGLTAGALLQTGCLSCHEGPKPETYQTFRQVLEVKNGYARNYLLPQGLAVEPTEANLRTIEAEKQTYLAEQAEELGVEIFPGMSCSELVYHEDGSVKGVVAGEFGRQADGSEGPGYEPGMELHGKYVFLGEGVRGSLSKQVIEKFALDGDSDVQKYGLGMKEIWEIDPAKHSEGRVVHTMGWPLGKNAGGGSFIYHLDNNQVYVGFVVHLGYENPHVFPYMEFQRFKHHPYVADLLKGGKRVAYGARAITEGGWQSLPKTAFPGGALLGCAAGMVNVPRIKGNHNAMLSGKAAAEAAHAALGAGRSADTLADYDSAVREGPIGADLKRVRNVKPLWSKYGLSASMGLGGFDMWMSNLTGWNPLGTLKHGKTDAAATGEAKDHKPIDYPRPDGKLSFDRLTNVS